MLLVLVVGQSARGAILDWSLQGDTAKPAADPAVDSLPNVVDSVEQAAQHTAQLTFEDELQGLKRLLQVQGLNMQQTGPCLYNLP